MLLRLQFIPFPFINMIISLENLFHLKKTHTNTHVNIREGQSPSNLTKKCFKYVHNNQKIKCKSIPNNFKRCCWWCHPLRTALLNHNYQYIKIPFIAIIIIVAVLNPRKMVSRYTWSMEKSNNGKVENQTEQLARHGKFAWGGEVGKAEKLSVMISTYFRRNSLFAAVFRPKFPGNWKKK